MGGMRKKRLFLRAKRTGFFVTGTRLYSEETMREALTFMSVVRSMDAEPSEMGCIALLHAAESPLVCAEADVVQPPGCSL